MKKEKPQKNHDPWPYDGPIARADGVRPFNHYLWPTESWWASRELGHTYSSRWNFGIIALADGRFSIEGTIWSIEKNEYDGRPCVYSTRTKALRIAAARMIMLARASRDWPALQGVGLNGSKLANLINWTRSIVARESGKPEPQPIQIKEPIPERQPTGLPLFDFANL